MPETAIVAAREDHKYYPYQGIFNLVRRSFWEAGQDSYTQPPAQNPDRFAQLTNIEPVTNGILQRRRGYGLFSSTIPSGPLTQAFSYRNEFTQNRAVVWTSKSTVLTFTEAGVLQNNPLFTPNAGADYVRMVQSRSYGYFADGIQQDNLKWDGTNLTNWGINLSGATTFGPKTAGSASQSGLSSIPWTNPSFAMGACDGNVAFCTVNAGNLSKTLCLNNFGFSITPANSVVVGISVSLGYTGSGSVSPGTMSLTLTAPTPGSPTGNVIYLPNQTTTGGTVQFGGPNYLFGLPSISTAIVNSTAFGFEFVCDASHRAAGSTLSIDCINVTVYTTPGPLTVGAPVGGNITLLSGRTYFYAYGNSSTGHVSGISPASASTGPLTSQNVPLSAIPTNPDPQVDTTYILATADGNDQTTLYLLATLSNGTATYTDTTPDTQLLTQPLFQYTDSFGNLHGIVNNNVPPAFKLPTKHKGRIYGAINSTLYFSKNLDDVTTANGLITSKWEEAFPAVNQMDISETAETIRGILSDGETLWIATERAIRRLVGDSPSNFQKPEIQFNETGIYNQDVWKVVFYEGQPVGTMWLTPDLRVMASDFNTYADVGRDIQDVLNIINPSATVGPFAAFVSKGPSDYYMLYLPTGSNNYCDTICVYNLRSKRWFIWQPSDPLSSAAFFIDGTGAPRWLTSTGASGLGANNLNEWLAGNYTDRFGSAFATTYACTMQTSWLDFGDSTLRKALNQLLYLGHNDGGLTVQVDGAIVDSDLDTTPQLVLAPTIVTVGPLQDLFLPLAGCISQHRWYRFTLVDSPSTAVDMLDGFQVEAVGLFRY